MALMTEFNSDLLTEYGTPLLAEYETEANGGSGVSMQAKATITFLTSGLLDAFRAALKAKATIRLLARHKDPQPPSGLRMDMKIIVDPFRPDVILDQYLLVWFHGHPNDCRIALKIDDGTEFQPAWVWQNPGTVNPAILRIDSAAIPGDGFTHLLKVLAWQEVGGSTSARAEISEYAKTPRIRPATQPEWCGATSIRQGEQIRAEVNGYDQNVGHISDLTLIEWRHSGAVQIIIKFTEKNQKTGITTIGYADYNETRFYAEDIGKKLTWTNGNLQEVLFGVAAIQNGTFGAITWCAAPVKIREIHPEPVKLDTNPDIATAEKIYQNKLRYYVSKVLYAEFGWIYDEDGSTVINYPQYYAAFTAIDKCWLRIKHILSKGGSVTLDNFGQYEARWNSDRTLRSVAFTPSPGFKEGTERGRVMTDAEAKAEAKP